MYLEISGLCAGVIALFATERFFSGMNQLVSLEIRRFCGGVSALLANERFFSGVNQHVALEGSSLIGGVIALCASKRLLTTMNQHMAFQMVRPMTCVVATVGLLSIIQRLLGKFCKIVCLNFHVFKPKITEVVS